VTQHEPVTVESAEKPDNNKAGSLAGKQHVGNAHDQRRTQQKPALRYHAPSVGGARVQADDPRQPRQDGGQQAGQHGEKDEQPAE
jgi:hypothetical protein